MPDYGLVTYTPGGKETFNSNKKYGKILGYVDIPSNVQSGSVTNSLFALGTPISWRVNLVTPGATYWNALQWSISGNTLNWSREAGSSSSSLIWARIWYGVML